MSRRSGSFRASRHDTLRLRGLKPSATRPRWRSGSDQRTGKTKEGFFFFFFFPDSILSFLSVFLSFSKRWPINLRDFAKLFCMGTLKCTEYLRRESVLWKRIFFAWWMLFWIIRVFFYSMRMLIDLIGNNN